MGHELILFRSSKENWEMKSGERGHCAISSFHIIPGQAQSFKLKRFLYIHIIHFLSSWFPFLAYMYNTTDFQVACPFHPVIFYSPFTAKNGMPSAIVSSIVHKRYGELLITVNGIPNYIATTLHIVVTYTMCKSTYLYYMVWYRKNDLLNHEALYSFLL